MSKGQACGMYDSGRTNLVLHFSQLTLSPVAQDGLPQRQVSCRRLASTGHQVLLISLAAFPPGMRWGR